MATENSRLKMQILRQNKISWKFQLGKILGSAHPNTISTQTSNIYWKQLQRYGQFAKLHAT